MKRLPTCVVLGALAMTLSARPAASQALMESAETINPGNIKLAAYGLRDIEADESGLVARAGIGLTDRLDVEGSVGFYDGVTYFGGDIEIWLVRDSPIDLSIGGGLHRSDFDGGPDIFGFDAFGILSGHLSDSVELYGSINLDLERPDQFDDFTIAHGVAGLEIALSQSLDVHLEGGAGLNDRSHDYLAVGLALYIR